MIREVDTVRRVKCLRPQKSPWFLPRQRLSTLLDQSQDFLFTVIVAPAGYGKTSLLSDWASQQERRVAWLSLDATDNQLDMFLLGLISAIQQVSPGLGNETLSLMTTGAADPARQYAAMLADELAEYPDAIFVVLDDFHHLDDAEVLEFFDALVRLPPPNLHFVIGSRHRLAASISASRLRGALFEVDASELAFVPDEAATYLGRAGLFQPTPGEIAHIVASMQGWPAGMHALALTLMAGSHDQTSQSRVQAAEKVTYEYLDHEILARLEHPFREFLVRMSIALRVSAGLAETLTSDMDLEQPAEAWLAEALRRELFLTSLGVEGNWYQFHSLFRRLLLNELQATLSPEEIGRLHIRASEWFLAAGDIEAAIDHALQSTEPQRAVDIVAAHAQAAIVADRWIQVEQWIEALGLEAKRLPLELLAAYAMVCQARGRYHALQGALQTMRDRLAAERPNLDQDLVRRYEGDMALLSMFASVEDNSLDGNTERLRGAYANLDGSGRFTELMSLLMYAPLQSVRDPQAANEFLDTVIDRCRHERTPFARLKLGWALCARAMVAFYIGNLYEALDAAAEGLTVARKCGADRLTAQCQFFLGITHYEMNVLDKAENELRAAMANPSCGALILTASVAKLAQCLEALGRPDEGDEVIERFIDRLLDSEQIDNVFNLRSIMARIAYARGDESRALALVESIHLSPSRVDIRTMEMPWLFKAILLLQRGEEGDWEEAAVLLDEVEKAIDSYQFSSFRLQLQLARALQNARVRDTLAATQVREALHAAERSGHVRSILDLGPAVSLLLGSHAGDYPFARRLLDGLTTANERSRVMQAAGHWPAQAQQPKPMLLEELTDREMQILRGLYHRMSNKEIAYELSISPLTVKSHTRNLYSKLGVNGRRQAIVRAVSLRIVP